jgi:RNase P subunit RPR2
VITRDEIEADLRATLKAHSCLACATPFTDAAVDWGDAQPSEYARGGPQRLRCEHCATIHRYNVFSRKLTRE